MTRNRAQNRVSLPFGAEVCQEGGVKFRVWAPAADTVLVALMRRSGKRLQTIPLEPEPEGFFSGLVPNAEPGMLYRYVLPSGAYPDPASRFQPEGPHGPSRIVDPNCFPWSDQGWKGTAPEGQVIYEMHIGTFTQEGTWAAAAAQLETLAELGITLLELMPVADFTGRHGWGYDGVNLFAPTRLYGSPDDFRAFVDRAHALGLGVILDVVYNHFGPEGNSMRPFSSHYFTDRYTNEWGDPLNFDGEHAAHTREFFIRNAGYWVSEFHIDGLRLDATQQIFDASPVHIVTEIAREVRRAGAGRATFLVAENECQDARLLRPESAGGHGLDAVWNDDLHHSAVVALTGRDEAYYTDYHGTPQEFVSAAKWGFLYQGQRYKWQGKRRGSPTLDLLPRQFVACIQNHDQVANSLMGRRIHLLASPGRLRAITAFLLLGPATPMLFQGQEFGASTPFLFFADHHPELARLVIKGRTEFLSQFPSISSEAGTATLIPDPEAHETFASCKLRPEERERHASMTALHKDLLRLRKETPQITTAARGTFDGAVLGPQAFLLRYFGEANDDRLLIVNLGPNLHLDIAPEPLLAPVNGQPWRVAWHSEEPRYGGLGMPPPESDDNWRLTAESAVFLMPSPQQP